MSPQDLLLAELYQSPQDSQAQALAARHAPLIYFDAREPFLPLAAGYTIFTRDGASSSMQREIQLTPSGKPAAACAIEYAIWWDWDIHHLYELEHAWVYLDHQDQVVRLEGSWHGEYHEIALTREDNRAVLLSEPGKHAFAPDPSWFRQRTAENRRIETQAVGMHAGVLINSMFAGKIREQIFDQVLARSYLIQQAFVPAWDFSTRFSFRIETLVPWATLAAWIPRRVNACLAELEQVIQPQNYCPLQLASTRMTLDGLQAAAQTGAEALYLPLYATAGQLRAGAPGFDSLQIDQILEFCQSEPLSAICEPDSLATTQLLASFLHTHGLEDSLRVTFSDPAWLLHFKQLSPKTATALQIASPAEDPLKAAAACGAQHIHLGWENCSPAERQLTSTWVERLHQHGIGVITWPVSDPAEAKALQMLGVDILWRAKQNAGTIE
jgi:hypothetical protein